MVRAAAYWCPLRMIGWKQGRPMVSGARTTEPTNSRFAPSGKFKMMVVAYCWWWWVGSLWLGETHSCKERIRTAESLLKPGVGLVSYEQMLLENYLVGSHMQISSRFLMPAEIRAQPVKNENRVLKGSFLASCVQQGFNGRSPNF